MEHIAAQVRTVNYWVTVFLLRIYPVIEPTSPPVIFFTSLNGYVNNRKNLYVSDAKPTSIAYRCINENLPKFLRNVECYKKVVQVIPKEQIEYMSNK